MRGLLRGDRNRSPGGPACVRNLYSARVEYQCHCADAERTADPHAHSQDALGTIHGMGNLKKSGVSRQSMLWQNRATPATANHATNTPAKRNAESGQCQP